MSRLELKIIPDAVWLAVGGLMWLVSVLTPSLDVPLLPRLGVTLVLLGVGISLIVAARVDLARARTTFNPTAPERSSALVIVGVYRFTRNPMYLGMLLVLLALAAWLANPWSLVLSATFVVYIDRLQIVPEERALHVRFGSAYDAYLRDVKRWI